MAGALASADRRTARRQRVGKHKNARRKLTGVVTEYGYTLAQAACENNGSGGVLVAVSNTLNFAHPIVYSPEACASDAAHDHLSGRG